MMGSSSSSDSIAIGIQGSVLVDSDMGIDAPLHYGVVNRCWRRGFKEQLTGHRSQICMQVMSRRSSGRSGAGGCGHGECTEKEECCKRNSCAERHYFVWMKFVKGVKMIVVVVIIIIIIILKYRIFFFFWNQQEI